MQVEPYLDAPPLHMSYVKGQSDCLILSFSGVGSVDDAIPVPEALKLAAGSGQHHVLSIADASRSWMNAEGFAEALLVAVRGAVSKIAPKRIVAFGNSMGGSMALIFATLFKLDAVLAIVPQYSVKQDVLPQENRWGHFRRNITHWPFPAVPALQALTAQVMILHGGDKGEMLHARRFQYGPSTQHLVVPNCGHALAARLKRAGILGPLIAAMAEGNLPAARASVMSAGGISFQDHWQNLSAARRERRQNAAI